MKKIFQEIAKELKVSPGLVAKIVNSQFKFVKDTMALGEKNRPDTFKTIQVTHLGKFAVRKKKIEFFKKQIKMLAFKGKKFNKKYPNYEKY